MDSRRRAWRRSRDDWRAQLGCGITLFVHRNGWNSDTWGPSWAPLLWPRAATPHTGHRTTGCPVCHLHFPLPPTSRRPHSFTRLGQAPPHGSTAWSRALSHTHVVGWSPRWPGRWAPCIRPLSRTQGHNMFPPSFVLGICFRVGRRRRDFDRRLCGRWEHLSIKMDEAFDDAC